MKDLLIGVLVIAVLLVIGIITTAIIDRALDKNKDKQNRKTYAGTILIHKSEEAIDGQVLFTKDLWNISELKEVTFKVKILPGEPGEWESKK